MAIVTNEETRRIVVGVDGSEPSKDALRWAVRQAALTGATVQAMIVWEYPASYFGWVADSNDVLDEQATQELTKVLDEVLARDVGVQVEAVVRRGNPALQLVDLASGADLLVVGSHGHGAFVGGLLGSVSNRCVHHATCPVTVIRHQK